MDIFERCESNVRAYCRSFPAVFRKAKGHTLWSEDGREYIDFFAGAGALNYGHNHPDMKRALLAYIEQDGITHALDMATTAKGQFLERFQGTILAPRGMTHKVMFPGPTGTNAVEAALKLARKVTGRSDIVSFTNAFHGMTLGSLAATGNAFKRNGAGVPLSHTIAMPFDGYFGATVDTLGYVEQMLDDQGSGVDLPAAIIVETVQGEGGVNVASFDWLKGLQGICRSRGVLLIVDDVQAGCGRTGPFFSFEPAGLDPDIICLSKSISGYGLPLALTLIKPEHDVFRPGEHNGTFRGNNPAFVTAAAALDFWETGALAEATREKGALVHRTLKRIAKAHPELKATVRGRGMMQGLVIGVDHLAAKICAAAFERGLIAETSGPSSEVVKIMPPLTIDEASLARGLRVLDSAIDATLSGGGRRSRAVIDAGRADGYAASVGVH